MTAKRWKRSTRIAPNEIRGREVKVIQPTPKELNLITQCFLFNAFGVVENRTHYDSPNFIRGYSCWNPSGFWVQKGDCVGTKGDSVGTKRNDLGSYRKTLKAFNVNSPECNSGTRSKGYLTNSEGVELNNPMFFVQRLRRCGKQIPRISFGAIHVETLQVFECKKVTA